MKKDRRNPNWRPWIPQPRKLSGEDAKRQMSFDFAEKKKDEKKIVEMPKRLPIRKTHGGNALVMPSLRKEGAA